MSKQCDVDGPSADSEIETEFSKIDNVLEEGTYVGHVNVETNERHGVGTCIFKDGSIYKGEWKYDKPCGRGFRVFLTSNSSSSRYLLSTNLPPVFVLSKYRMG